jgi:hypothetical protein
MRVFLFISEKFLHEIYPKNVRGYLVLREFNVGVLNFCRVLRKTRGGNDEILMVLILIIKLHFRLSIVSLFFEILSKLSNKDLFYFTHQKCKQSFLKLLKIFFT